MNKKRVKIIASHPEHGQDGIEKLIGQTFPVEAFIKHIDLDGKARKTGQVHIKTDDGLIVLQPDEFEIL